MVKCCDARGAAVRDEQVAIERLDVAAYTIPTDAPESEALGSAAADRRGV
jgi:hypothetical protein